MKDSELRNRIEKSLQEGFSPEEVVEALREDGYDDQRISKVVTQAQKELQAGKTKRQGNSRNVNQNSQRNEKRKGQGKQRNSQNNAQNQDQGNQSQRRGAGQGSRGGQGRSSVKDTVPGVDLSDTEYVLKQSFIRNKYALYGEREDLLLRAKQKLFKLREELPFKDSDGNVFMRVKAESVMDVAGDYTLVDEENDEPIAVLEKKWSFLHHKWKIKKADSRETLLAKVSSRGGMDKIRFLGDIIPYFPNIFKFIPHHYKIENPEGEEIGSIEGRFGIRDIYDLEVEARDAPRKRSLRVQSR